MESKTKKYLHSKSSLKGQRYMLANGVGNRSDFLTPFFYFNGLVCCCKFANISKR